MTRTHAKLALWVLGAALLFFVGFNLILSGQFSAGASDTWKAMESRSFSCPPGTEVTTRGWSKNGYMRYCEATRNGQWEAWSEGYLHVQGQYASGKEHGTWRWFNRDGSLAKTIVFDKGTKVSEQTAEK